MRDRALDECYDVALLCPRDVGYLFTVRWATHDELERVGERRPSENVDYARPDDISHLTGVEIDQLRRNDSFISDALDVHDAFDDVENIRLHIGKNDLPLNYDLDIVVYDSPRRRIEGVGSCENLEPLSPDEHPTVPLVRSGQFGVKELGQIYRDPDNGTYTLFITQREVFNDRGQFAHTVSNAAPNLIENVDFDTSGHNQDEFLARSVASSIRDQIDKPDVIERYEAAEQDIRAQRSELRNKAATLRSLVQQRAEAEQQDEGDLAQELAEQLDNIRNNTKVKSIRFDDLDKGYLWVRTEKLIAEDPRHNPSPSYHSIGEFELLVSLTNTRNAGIHAFNLTRRVNGYDGDSHAPHIFNNDGSPCSGNFDSIVKDLRVSGQVDSLVSQSIRFLESANTSDPAGEHVEDWPVVSEHDLEEYREKHGALP